MYIYIQSLDMFSAYMRGTYQGNVMECNHEMCVHCRFECVSDTSIVITSVLNLMLCM